MNTEAERTPENPEPNRGWLGLLKAIVIGPATPLSERLVGPTYGALVGIGFGIYYGAEEGGILGAITGVALGLPLGALIGALSVHVYRK
jgi:hypothetical protein